MIDKLVGMKLSVAKEFLQSENIDFQVVFYNDKKMNSWDETLVLRATENDGKIILVATNFLFKPEKEA